MNPRLQPLVDSIRGALARLAPAKGALALLVVIGAAGYALYRNPPVRTVPPGEAGVRENRLTGELTQWRDGSVLVIPLVHDLHVYSLRDRRYRPAQMAKALGPAPLQSQEGLSLGVDLSVRYAIDPAKLREVAGHLPADVDADVVEPAVSGTVYKVFARYTVREIFSTKRPEIQQVIEKELKSRLAGDGIVLKDVFVGNVDLPAEYRRGMDQRSPRSSRARRCTTLERKDKRRRKSSSRARRKTRQDRRGGCAGRRSSPRRRRKKRDNVLPFKQRQVEQRRLRRRPRRNPPGAPQRSGAASRRGARPTRARAGRRRSLSSERVGKASADRWRGGAVVTAHPLLIQKALADKPPTRCR
jgi:regulator of protease activity HflC (stomatin/prohibitin superfamily)